MMYWKFATRSAGVILVTFSAIAAGCSRSDAEPSLNAESPEEQAARVFSLAQELESRGQTQKAYAAYHLLIKKFPTSPEASKADIHIKKVQAAAGRKRKPAAKRS